MSLERLRELAPPPSVPAGTGSAELWKKVETRLGLTLPADYKQLVDTYGSGRFGNFLTVFTPFTTDPYTNLLSQDELALAAYRELRAAEPELTPFPAYPEPGGLLPWAQSDNGDVAYWLTGGPSDRWPVILVEARHGSIERFDVTTTGFLERMLDRTLASEIFPRQLSTALSARFVASST